MGEVKCPICGKVGIPDYHNADIVCPQCQSDLRIFRVIDRIPDEKPDNKNVWKPLTFLAILAAAVCGFFWIMTVTSGNKAEENAKLQMGMLQDSIRNIKVENQQEIKVLNDSLSMLVTMIKRTGLNPEQIHSDSVYVIKSGDCFWTISESVYGTGFKASQLAQKNGKTLKSVLKTGDILYY